MKKIKQFSDLVDCTFTSIENTEYELIFTLDDGRKFKMYHEQDCCESVYLDDVTGDLDSLIGQPIMAADEVSSDEEDREFSAAEPGGEDSFTWTFYHIRTMYSTVTLRWYGSSNGYYSERVDFASA